MKYFLAVLAILGGSVAPALGQSLGVNLTWTPPATYNANNPGTVQVYRAAGTCTQNSTNNLPSGTGWSEIMAKAPEIGPYLDSNVVDGNNYCYYVTATEPGFTQPSGPSNLLDVAVVLASGPAAPTGLKATIVQLP